MIFDKKIEIWVFFQTLYTEIKKLLYNIKQLNLDEMMRDWYGSFKKERDF